MYDILLHQVSPNWDCFVKDWLPNTDCVIVYNQNWLKSAQTMRFIDQGFNWFRDNVVFVDEKTLARWFDEHDDYDDGQKKLKRDMHNYWQWGITPNDMVQLFIENGFDLMYMKNYGPFHVSKPWIVNDGMIFIRSSFR